QPYCDGAQVRRRLRAGGAHTERRSGGPVTAHGKLVAGVAGNLMFRHDERVPLDDAAARPLVETLERNKVPVATLPASAHLEELEATAAGAEYVTRHRKRYARLRSGFEEVARAWRDDDVPFVLVKSTGAFPYTSDNVDVLVPQWMEAPARQRLAGLGFTELAHLREPFKRYFALLEDRARGSDVHLHTEIAWISKFLSGSAVADGREAGDDVWAAYPSATHSLLIVTGHWFYEDKEMKLRDVQAMAAALRRGVDWDDAWRTAGTYGWDRGFRLGLEVYDEAVRRHGFDAPLADPLRTMPGRARPSRFAARVLDASDGFPVRFSRLKGKALHYLKTWEDRTLGPAAKVGETALVTKFAAQVKTPAGPLVDSLVVTCSGPDGSGKTTTAKAAIERLESFGLPAHYHWMRVGDSRFLDLVKAAAGPLVGAPSGGGGGAGGPAEMKTMLSGRDRLRAAWGWVLALDFLARAWGKTARARLQGGVHVFDRHAVDAAVELEAVYGFGHAGFVAAAAPDADLRVLLTARGADLATRGDSPLAPAALETFLRIYRDPRWRFDEELDTTSSAEQVSEELARLTLARLVEKTSGA
ncbi:MAG TPA: hypothetical protein VEU29_03850, partial [Actinomycetota bacterium]|nr:hypothetical protein [Actinomycetota bacterium]